MEAYGKAGMVASGCSVEAVDMVPVEDCAIVEVDMDLYSFVASLPTTLLAIRYTCGFMYENEIKRIQ